MGCNKWRPEYSEMLRGRNVAIVPDNDLPGHKHAQTVAQALAGMAAAVKVVELPGLADKGDVSDWLNNGGSKAALLDLTEAAPIWEPGEVEADAKENLTDAARFKLTESGAGDRFAFLNKDKVRYCFERESWLWFDGKHWTYECQTQLEKLRRKTVAHVDQEYVGLPGDDPRRKQLQQHSAALQRKQYASAMLWFAGRQDGIGSYFREFDSDLWLLNCANGTIDLRTGELRPHSADDMLTKIVNVNYDPNAEAPIWNNFLQRVMAGNEVLIDYLQTVVGMSLSGSVNKHVFFILYGSGANGKSVFCDTLVNMLGDYACEAAPNLFTATQFDEHPTDVADIAGKRLVIGSETEEGRRPRTDS